jgi:hypothetical protein
MARIAVRQQLDEMLSLTLDSKVQLQKGCAEQNENGGIVVGAGEASNSSRLIDGVPVNEASRFSYRASVLAGCDPYNLNCYKVGNIDVTGSRSIVPRLWQADLRTTHDASIQQSIVSGGKASMDAGEASMLVALISIWHRR